MNNQESKTTDKTVSNSLKKVAERVSRNVMNSSMEKVVKAPAKKMPKETTSNVGCSINFSKVSKRSVGVYSGDKKIKDVEILGSRGKYSVYTDPNKKSLLGLRGTSGSLKDVKSKVAEFMCKVEIDNVAPATKNSSKESK